MTRIKYIIAPDKTKWKLSEIQLEFMDEVVLDPYMLWDRIKGSQKISCRSLEKIGIVDRHASGKIQLTPKGVDILEEHHVKR